MSEISGAGAAVEIGGIPSISDFLKRKFHGFVFPNGIIRVGIKNLESCLF